MTTPTPPVTLDTLLSHADWVRNLARSLVQGDGHDAEDVAQETWLAAVRQPPPSDRNLRAWLAQIVRRTVWKRRRSAGRRDERERRAAGPESTEPADIALERAALHRDLVAALLELEEPYRTPLVLRYFEGLAPGEIATRTRQPLNTVRSQLQRGLARLRKRLDREYGDRRQWIGALVPLTGVPAQVGTGVALGVLIMKHTKLTVAGLVAASLLAVSLISGWWDRGPTEDTAPPAAPVDVAREAGTASDSGDPAGRTGSDPAPRTPVAVAVPGATDPAPPGVGRIVDLNGDPWPGLRLRRDTPRSVRWQAGDRGWIGDGVESRRINAELEARLLADPAAAIEYFSQFEQPEEWRATVLGEPIPEREIATDAAGSFPIPGGTAGLRCVEPGIELVGVGRDERGPVWVAATSVRLEGKVMRADGGAVSTAYVEIDVDLQPALASLPTGFEVNAVELPDAVRTDAAGSYLARRVPAIPGAVLRARAEGLRAAHRPVPASDDAAFDFVLQPRAFGEGLFVAGVVLTAEGNPAGGAQVALGRDVLETDASGQFAFAGVTPEQNATLSAWLVGYQPLQLQGVRGLGERDPRGLAQLVLRLPGRARTMRGTVLDAAGQPMADVRINPLVPTWLDFSFTPLEARVGGREREVTTDTQGRFSLSGLGDRPYRLRLWRSETVPLTITDPLDPRAGEVVIRVPALRASVAGRVLDAAGAAMPGARVAIAFATFSNRGGGGEMWDTSAPVTTDANGRFRLAEVPKEVGYIAVEAPDGGRSLYPVASLPGSGPIVLRHGAALVLEVVPMPESQVDAFRVLDARGRPLEVIVHAGGARRETTTVTRDGSGFPTCTLPEGATTVSLLREGVETETIAIPEDSRLRYLLRAR